LSAQAPERVAAMAAQYEAWARRTHVIVEGIPDPFDKPARKGQAQKRQQPSQVAPRTP